ncbi:MAG: sulfatase-like hydrolase/transferase [Candidatus Lokiarchaeota archaeon]|nr:sulfatase-like hydrolase/transferase [Candidatus Lokiarchaeota archaeon]
MSCYNNDMVLKTPNIDRIANEGIKFTNFYCNNPICMPNRSTIFTGQYPSVHGVTTNGRNLPQGTNTFADILLKSGIYHTAYFGKVHLNYFGAESGEFKNAVKSQEFVHPRQYGDLTQYSPYFGLDEVKIISGHGTLCGHPDYINWVKKKIEKEPSLGKPLRIKLSNPDNLIQAKINVSLNTADPLLKLQVVKHKVPEELYSTTFVKENTIGFLKSFSEGSYSKENFLLFTSFPDPHHPFSPPGKYFDMYNPSDVKLPETFNDDHERSSEFNKKHFNTLIRSEGTEKGIFPIPKDLTEENAKRVIAASYGVEKMIDDAVGEVLDALNEYGLSENTVIIFTTDHGDLGGDHRFFFKGPFLYQGLIKIPFLIKVPEGQTNKECSSLVSSIDIPETILDLAGITIPDFMQGTSLVSILNKPEDIVKNEVLIEMNDDHNNEKTRTLITDEWRITVFANHGDLYNLKEDPNETNNLWNDNSYSEIKSELLLKLLKRATKISKSVVRDCGF